MGRFAELLKSHRRRAGLTQQQLGDKLRLSSPYIAQIESGLKPPPPPELIEKQADVLRLNAREKEEFIRCARAEREIKSLEKATRKLGYALAGNNVLISEAAISDAIKKELRELFKESEEESERGMFVGGYSIPENVALEGVPILRHRGEMEAWLHDYVGDEPQVGLKFLSMLYEMIQLVNPEEIACHKPTPLRKTIEEERCEPGRLLARLKSTIDKAREELGLRSAPHVVPVGEQPVKLDTASEQAAANRYIPVVGVVEAESDAIVPTVESEPVEIPRSWLDDAVEYRAVEVRSDAFEGFGLWPGTTLLYEVGAEPSTDDIVVIELDGRVTILVVKARLEGEGNMILQGGGRSAPVVYLDRNDNAEITGVVRHFMSTFRDMKKARRLSTQEEKK